MKSIILAATLAFSVNASAIGVTSITNSWGTDTPNTSDWAVAMTAQACGVELASFEGATGAITKTAEGVVYTVTMNGEVVAAASAKNTFIFSKKTCL